MIIITGGAGFIGSNIAFELERSGYKDIVIIDRLGKGEKWRNIAKRELGAIISPEDTEVYLKEHIGEIETIIHMGAISDTTETDADLIIQSNFMLTFKLWCFCRDFSKRFIYASSAATYGAGELGFKDESDIKYLNSLRPLNKYGWSKALFDRKAARELLEKRGAPPQYVGLKFFNVYGPNEYHKGAQKSVAAHIYPDIIAGKAVRLFKSYNSHYANGQQKRDFVWVGDIAAVILWLLKNPKVSGLFNIGSGQARSFYDLACSMFSALGLPEKIEYIDMPPELRGRYQYFTEANLLHLRQAGYSAPMTKLECGIKEYAQQYLSQADIYR